MTLKSGDQLGPYRVIERIGVGGMGEVYRAHDPRLARDVAIKISSERFSERFSREAHAIAALNHSNVCHLYDVGPNYLVMEVIDGPTLAERIHEGAVPLDEALKIARQIADALDAAHEKGIVHRDLKPGNVKIGPAGAVKVLDFGLAKIGAQAEPSENSPTVTANATEPGVILGTASYMAPEQVKGKAVDRRADIWAFGVVLYEMITGLRPFRGDTTTEVLASILKEEPNWDRVPTQLQRLLRHCLEKDPHLRLRHIADVMMLVDETSTASQPASTSYRKRWLWPSVAALLLLTVAALGYLNFRGRTSDSMESEKRFQIPLPENSSVGTFAVSPDGRRLVFRVAGATPRLWVRDLNSLEAHPLPNTDGASDNFFWSHDSRFIAFSGGDRKLRKIDLSSGIAQNICDISSFDGGSWNADDVIIFGALGGVMQVSASGGTPSLATVRDASRNELAHVHPVFLPDGRHFLYLAPSSNPDYAGVYVGSLDTTPNEQPHKRLLATGFSVVYAASTDPDIGKLLFVRDGTLLAQTFDARRMELTGEPTPIAEQVRTDSGNYRGSFTASTGLLIYFNGVGDDISQLTWYNRQGKTLGTVAEPAAYSNVLLSPDSTRASFVVGGDVWVVDLTRGTSIRLTTSHSLVTSSGVWSPDGSHIAYTSNPGGVLGIYQTASSGAGVEELLWKADALLGPTHWSADGKFLVFGTQAPKTVFDIWVLPLQDRKAFPILQTEFGEVAGRFSPDSRWVAYRTNESGKDEIYVQAFAPDANKGSSSAPAARWAVSKGGSVGMARWKSDGKELYYLTKDGKIMVVEITTSPSFRASEPKLLFQTPPNFVRPNVPGAYADVSADGNKFLLAMPLSGAQQGFTAVLNWTSSLRK